jgi:hypothetical protein
MYDFEDSFPLLAEIEPVTSLTDLLVSFSGFYFFILLKKEPGKGNVTFGWRNFFLFMGLSTFFGTFSHILEHKGYQKIYFVLWNIMQILGGLAMFYAQRAAISEVTNKILAKVLLYFANLQLMIFIPSVLYFQDFKVVAFNSLLVIILMLLLFFPRTQNTKSSFSLIWFGFIISVLTVFIHQQKIGFSRWFNHKDVSHILMILSLWLINKGVRMRHQLSGGFAIA